MLVKSLKKCVLGNKTRSLASTLVKFIEIFPHTNDDLVSPNNNQHQAILVKPVDSCQHKCFKVAGLGPINGLLVCKVKC